MQRGAALRGVNGNADGADKSDGKMKPEKFRPVAHHDRDALAGMDTQFEQAIGGALDIVEHLLPGETLVLELEPDLARVLRDAMPDQLLDRSLKTRHVDSSAIPARLRRRVCGHAVVTQNLACAREAQDIGSAVLDQ